MRLLANAVIARSINDLVSVAQKAITSNKTVTIIDLGAKYMKTSRILLEMFRQRNVDANRWFYSPERNNLTTYDRTYHDNLPAYEQRRL